MSSIAPRRSDVSLGDDYAGIRLLGVADGVARYAAVEQSTRRHVVLKMAEVDAPEHVRAALEDEAAILAAIGGHPNIVTMFQQTQTRDGRHVLVLERCCGTFAELFGFATTPVPQALTLAVKLAGALATVHRAGVVHCALGPSTMMLSEFTEPVLADFDAAIPRSDPARAAFLIRDPTVHTAPELLLGEPATEATDVYGLAATLYQLVSGHAPFRSYAGDSAATISARVLCGTVAPLADGSVAPDLSDLLLWALAPEPTARPLSAVWFAEELGRLERRFGWTRTPCIIGVARAHGPALPRPR